MAVKGSYTIDNFKLPEWVADNIMTSCFYCGALLCDNSSTGVMTSRWCTNPHCPGHMQYKVEALAKHFGKDGFGVKSALRWVKDHPGECHLNILREWFREPPLVPLSTVAKLAFVRGYGEISAVKELDSFENFEDYFNNVTMPDTTLLLHKDYLLQCSAYFKIQRPMAKLQMTVMGTGTFTGFQSRTEFFDLVNQAFGHSIHVIETKGVRKTGVAYLIKENNAPDRSKSHIAKEYGIPTVSPKEFYEILRNWCHI